MCHACQEETCPCHPDPRGEEEAEGQAARGVHVSQEVQRCPELIAQMAAKGYWTSPKGKTPSSTLYAAMMREVQQKGKESRFIKTGPGRFAHRGDAERS